MTESEEKKKSKKWIISTAIVLAIAILATCCFFIFRTTETRETSNKDTYSIGALNCEATSPNGAFFSPGNAISNKHNIKMTLKEDKPDKITYSYEGEFETGALAETVSSGLHADYNIDMSGHDQDPESLVPTFVATGRNVRVNFYTDVNKLNSVTAKYFFLTANEQRELKTYSEKTIQKIYENVGFKCVYNN